MVNEQHNTENTAHTRQDGAPKLLLDRQEAAAALGVCVRTLDSLVTARRINHAKINRRILFRRVDLETFIARTIIPAKSSSHAV